MTDSPLARPEWAAFVADMRREPDEDVHRLVAADWLQDQGTPCFVAWAEFIRLQVEAAAARRLHVYGDSCDCTGCRAERRATLLFDQWHVAWEHHAFGHCEVRPEPAKAADYVRGFPHCVRMVVESFRAAELPMEASAPFLLVPLVALSADLKVPTATGYPGLRPSLYELVVTARSKPGPTGLPPYIVVRAQLNHAVAGRETLRSVPVGAVRTSDRPRQLTRSVRGAVRQVVARRGEIRYEPRPPAGAAS